MSWAEVQYAVDKLTKPTTSGVTPKSAKLSSSYSGGDTVTLRVKLPEDTIFDIGDPICYVKEIVVVIKQDSKSKDISDGTIVSTINRPEPYVAGNRVEITHSISGFDVGDDIFFTAFTVSDGNIVNTIGADYVHIIKGTVGGYINGWAFHQDFTNGDVLTNISYTIPEESKMANINVLNTDYDPMVTTFAVTGEEVGDNTYGSWETFVKDTLKNHPYVIKNYASENFVSGDPDAVKRIVDNNYTYTIDGQSSKVDEHHASNLTNYMRPYYGAWLAKLYMKEVYSADGSSRDVYFIDQENYDKGGNNMGFHSVGFTDFDGNELEGIFIPMYYPHPYYQYNSSTTQHDIVNDKFAPSAPRNNGSDTSYDGMSMVAGGATSTDTVQRVMMPNVKRGAYLGTVLCNYIRDLVYLMYRTTYIYRYAAYGLNSGWNNTNLNYWRNQWPAAYDVWGSARGIPGFYGHASMQLYSSGDMYGASTLFHSYVLGFMLNTLFDDSVFFYRESGKTNYTKIKATPKYIRKTSTTYCRPDDASYVEIELPWAYQNGYCPKWLTYLGDGLGSIPDGKAEHSGVSLTSTYLCSQVSNGATASASANIWVPAQRFNYQTGLSCYYMSADATTLASNSFAVVLVPPPGYSPE